MCSLDKTVACHWQRNDAVKTSQVRRLASFYPFELFYAVHTYSKPWQVTIIMIIIWHGLSVTSQK